MVLEGVGNGVAINSKDGGVAIENMFVAVVLLSDITDSDWKLPVRMSDVNIPRSNARHAVRSQTRCMMITRS